MGYSLDANSRKIFRQTDRQTDRANGALFASCDAFETEYYIRDG